MRTNSKIVCAGGMTALLLCSLVLLSGCVTTHMVPMRDGISLATTVYTQRAQQPHGVILIRTPYNQKALSVLGAAFAKNGWPTVTQDTRGRFGSEGVDTVFRDDATDGYDTLAWIATQSFSNGKVATFGGSALGITQYLAAGQNPPALACQYIQVATPNLYKHAMYQGGQFRQNLVVEWLKAQGSSSMLPQVYLHENSSDAYWDNVTIDTHFEDVNVPAIHIGGWYDIFSAGTVDGFVGYQYHGGPGAQGKSKLIMGPWTHGGAAGRTQGQLTYPENCVDNFSAALFWAMADQYTMGTATEYDAFPAVTYYVMGDVTNPDAPGNEWRVASDWPVPATDRSWYLQGNRSLLPQSPLPSDPLTYRYDPANPVPTLGGQELNQPPGPYDQRPVENRSDVLVFTSPALVSPYEATGSVSAVLYLSSDCPDTDVTVKLSDVYPDGRSMLITDGILRLRNRNGTDHWEFMEQGAIYQVTVDLGPTSYIWDSGHCIRVAVSSSNAPRFLPNPNTRDPMAGNTTSQVAENAIFLDPDHPSCLVLPEVTDAYQGPTVHPASYLTTARLPLSLVQFLPPAAKRLLHL